MVNTLQPIGARLLVTDETPIDTLSQRATQAGLTLVLEPGSQPAPTTGIVIAVGTDPFIQEQIHVGDRVYFNRYAGSSITHKGTPYRSLDYTDVIMCEPL